MYKILETRTFGLEYPDPYSMWRITDLEGNIFKVIMEPQTPEMNLRIEIYLGNKCPGKLIYFGYVGDSDKEYACAAKGHEAQIRGVAKLCGFSDRVLHVRPEVLS